MFVLLMNGVGFGFGVSLMMAVSARDLLEFALGLAFDCRLFGGLCFLNFLISVFL